MPHLEIKISPDYQRLWSPEDLMAKAHKIILETGVFEEKNIRVRLIVSEFSTIGGKFTPFFHGDLYILKGRSEEVRARASQSIYDGFRALFTPEFYVSFDILQRDPKIYHKDF